MVQATADDERAVQLAREAVELVDAGHQEVRKPMILTHAPHVHSTHFFTSFQQLTLGGHTGRITKSPRSHLPRTGQCGSQRPFYEN
jgi:hypothetical protein